MLKTTPGVARGHPAFFLYGNSELKNKVGVRRRAREMALQMLYQIELSQTPPEDAIPLFYEIFSGEEDLEFDVPIASRPFAEDLVIGVETHLAEIDRTLAQTSQHWRLERMTLIDKNILRIALYEMLYLKSIPPKVSVNEAIEIGKSFGTEDSGAFINGILDHILTHGEERERGADPPAPGQAHPQK